MRNIIALAVLAGLIALVASESCLLSTASCNHETCTGTGWNVHCVNRVCTCLQDTGNRCTAAGDCNCDNGRTPHCIDGHCRCGFGGGR
ncbi:uncharacterized protein LOC128230032 [Mya arenaria]|uniref:uncharacterized protein LOC128230032 n=1 Tax=Mya arenaria TaxID=6604 RepID=UPI0022E8C0E3|nr:uncharacterized protein LOC128230032 [Mya arenaria]